jgi:hypothetical protein
VTDAPGTFDDQDAWAQLLRPWAASRWFDADPLPDIEPERDSFSAANAWWLAELSRLSYRNSRRTVELQRVGLREAAFLSLGGTQCLIAVPATDEPHAALCVFRGSDEPRDWWTNLQVVPDPWPEGGEVHKGFHDAFRDAWSAVAPALDALGLPELFGGHSLGGALALLAASIRRPAGVYAFGAPRVGDDRFAATLVGVPTFRLRHGRDVVPSLPPSTPALHFAQPGEGVHLDAVGQRRWSDPPLRLLDHAPARYVEALRRRLGESLPGASAPVPGAE